MDAYHTNLQELAGV